MIRVFPAALLTLASTGAFAQNLGQAPGPGYVPLSTSINSWLWTLLNPGGGGTGNTVANMVAFGADPTGVADSCGAPLTNALAALSALPTGGIMYWPAGTYTCGNQIQWSNKSITIQGDGPSFTSITFTSAVAGRAGIFISQNSGNFSSNVNGLSVLTSVVQPVNNGIAIFHVDPMPKIHTAVTLNNLNIEGVGSNFGNFYWNNGIYCSGCAFAYLTNINITGGNLGQPPTGWTSSQMFAGLNMNGQGLAGGGGGGFHEASTGFLIEGVRVALSQIGVYMSGDSEGAHVHGISTIQVNHGIYLDDYAGSMDPTAQVNVPGPFIFGQDCAAFMDCLLIKGGWSDTGMWGSQWTKIPPPTLGAATPQFTAVRLLDGQYKNPSNPTGPLLTSGTVASTISNNQCAGVGDFTMQPDKQYQCFQLGNNAIGNFISDNLVQFVHEFIDFGAGVNPNVVTGNSQVLPNAGVLNHWAIGTTSQDSLFKDNRPVVTAGDGGVVILPDGTATPSMMLTAVSGFSYTVPQLQGALYFLNNASAAQNITDILGGYIGQVITVTSQTANNTIISGDPGITLRSAASYAIPAGGTLTLIKVQRNQWVEITRTP